MKTVAFLHLFRSPPPRPRCQCGEVLVGDECPVCDWESESGPVSKRPDDVRKAVGQ
jgi:hypothetical protein